MSEPRFLEWEEVVEIHQLSIARFGGTLGIRDVSGAQAAVAQPMNVFFYSRGDLFEIAAAYAFHISQAQAFLDGNKRTAIAACLAFLERNEIRAIFRWEELYHAMIAIAERRLDRTGFAAMLREQARNFAADS